MKHRFITFLSDFGLADDFVGACHGVIKRLAPDAEIIDITHGIAPQAVLQGAFVLAKARHGPKVAADCLDHLKLYFETLLPISRAEHAAA